MTVNLSALGGAGQQFFDNSGNPLTGGKLYSYQAGTTTPQTTYTTAAGNVAHANPIILDSAGRVATGEIWLTAGSNYKFVLADSNDVVLATWDNITGINGTGIAANAVNVVYDPAGVGAIPTTVQAKLRETVSVKDFGAVGDGMTDDTVAVQAALNAGVGKTVYIPPGDYVISSKLLISPQTHFTGSVAGIGTNEKRGASLWAAAGFSDFILENRSLTAAPSDPFAHGIRVEHMQFRQFAGSRTASGFNIGPCGDMSAIRHCKFNNLVVALKVGGTVSPQGVQVSCNLDTVSFYSSNTGLLFQNCSFTAGVRNIMLDGCTIPVHFKDCGLTFHCNIDQWHAENLPAATEIFYVDNCSGSYHEIRAGSVEAAGASATLSIVRITRTTASNKARVKVANAFSTVNTNYILNDVDLSVSWTQAELGLSYGEISHNFNTVLNSGQGVQIFGKSYSGTWIPIVADAASGGNVGTATVVAARFQRIGDMVFVQGNLTGITTTGMTAGNALFIQGLSFAANGSFNRQVGSAVASNIATGSVYACSVVGGGSALRLTKTANADVLVSDVVSGSGLAYFSIAYTV